MDSNIKSELAIIAEARKAAYRPTPLMLALIVAGLVVEYFFPSIGALFGIAAFIIFYQRLAAVAHLPCPKCGEPFGTATKFPLGIGAEHCQSCGLSLNGN